MLSIEELRPKSLPAAHSRQAGLSLYLVDDEVLNSWLPFLRPQVL
jgi:hypothetical protein